ncbi:MAG: EamA family transporter [Cyanobacteria bacterium J06633_8]
MTPQELSLLLMSVFTSVAGQFFLKAGALKLGKVNAGNIISHIFNMITTSEVVIGLACYGFGAIAYILLLTRVNLSIAAPSVSLVYVLSTLLGYFIFRETIPVTRLFGLSFIIAGVILVVWQK